MGGLFYYWRIYRKLIANYIKDRMSFRVDFFMGLVGVTCINVSGIATLLLLFRTVPTLGGWDYNEMLLLFGFFELACEPVWLLFDKLWSLWGDLERGDFILCYFKPINTMFYYMSDVLNLKSFGSLVFAVIVFVYALAHLSVAWTVWKVVCFILMYAGSVFVFGGLRILFTSTAFWMGRNVSIMNFTMRLEAFTRYPLTIFARPFRFVFMYILPFAFIAYVPVNDLLRSPDVSPAWFLTPLVGAAVFAMACLVWTLGVRHYTGTGT
jgi:ABC-2 type transport system permease protein